VGGISQLQKKSFTSIHIHLEIKLEYNGMKAKKGWQYKKPLFIELQKIQKLFLREMILCITQQEWLSANVQLVNVCRSTQLVPCSLYIGGVRFSGMSPPVI
jgi:hypothetical protein